MHFTSMFFALGVSSCVFLGAQFHKIRGILACSGCEHTPNISYLYGCVACEEPEAQRGKTIYCSKTCDGSDHSINSTLL